MKKRFSQIKSLLSHPLVNRGDIDKPETSLQVSKLIQQKTFLKRLYIEWYESIDQRLPADISGPVLELGSGGGFLKQHIKRVITSEILAIPTVDIVLDGQRMPLKKESLRAIVMVDVLHHLPRATDFFKEAARTVKAGGVMVMIEPWNTKWSSFIYKHLHHEPFDEKRREWNFPAGGPLSQANSALPWILFKRDAERFRRTFPEWRIQEIQLHTPFSYLISGGVSMKSFLPAAMFDFCHRAETLLAPWLDRWAMFATVTLRH